MNATPLCKVCRDAGVPRLADVAIRIGGSTMNLCWKHARELLEALKALEE